MKKITFILLMCFCFVSCGNENTSERDVNVKIIDEKEYDIALDDVFEVLEETDKEKLEVMFGKSQNDELYDLLGFEYYQIGNYAYFNKQDYKFSYVFWDGDTKSIFLVDGYEDNEDITIQIKEQLERNYGFQMQETTGMFEGMYLRLYYCENGLDFYFACYYRYDGEKSHIFGKYHFKDEEEKKKELEMLYDLKEMNK